MSGIFGRMGGPREDDELDEPLDVELDVRGARWVRRHLAGAVVGLTTVAEDRYRAATLTACVIVSIEPLQCLVSIEADSQMETWLRTSRVFAVNILAWEHQFVADQFAGLAPLASPDFRGIEHFTAVTGSPILTAATGWIDCTLVDEIETGDHYCFIGQAVAVGRGQGNDEDPLLYFINRYRRFR